MPISALLDGLQLGREKFGVESRVVIDHGRSQPEEIAMRALKCALRYKNRGVVAFGLGGNEQWPPELFERVFLAAIDGGLHSVPHAGEMLGPESIRGAIVRLRAERIGQGIRILEDPELVAIARERRISPPCAPMTQLTPPTLEVCPTSNVMLGMVRSREEHPLRGLIDAGLRVTLNSDIPGVLGTNLSDEYRFARDEFGLNDRALAQLARAGVAASFADEGVRTIINREIDDWLGNL